MNTEKAVPQDKVEKLYKKLKQEAEASGYHLNPDEEFTKDLVQSLLINEERYGYQACPCRLASGKKEDDLDIICPCDYRDPDLNEYDSCFCGLYVSNNILTGDKKLQRIPERRPAADKRVKKNNDILVNISHLSQPVWRCKVCGYLCARENPPEICPICKVTKDRFEKFI